MDTASMTAGGQPERPDQPDSPTGSRDAEPGAGLVRALGVATVGFAVVAAISAAFHFRDHHHPPHSSVFAVANVMVSLTLFALGCVAFVVGFLRAVRRSRSDQIDLGALMFLLGGVAPKRIRRGLVGCYVAQALVAVATAVTRPFTDQAFVILAPMCGQGVMTLWSGTYGTFPDRQDERARRATGRLVTGADNDSQAEGWNGERGEADGADGQECGSGDDPTD